MHYQMTGRTRVLVLLASALLVMAVPAFMLVSLLAAQEEGPASVSSVPDQPCLRDATAIYEGQMCIASDVKLGAIELLSGPSSCVPGEIIVVTLKAQLESTPENYDVRIWVDQEGGDALEAGAGSPGGNPDLSVNRCFRDYLNPVSLDNGDTDLAGSSGPFYNGEIPEPAVLADACGDLAAATAWEEPDDLGDCTQGGGTCVFTYYDFAASIECRDSGDSGVADVGTCASWNVKGASGTCENGSSFWVDTLPDRSPKCVCVSVEIAGLIVPKTGTIQVDKLSNPADDAGRFNLQVDSQDEATNVRNGGSIDPVIVSAGTDPPGTGESHTVGETGFAGTDLANYNMSILCDD